MLRCSTCAPPLSLLHSVRAGELTQSDRDSGKSRISVTETQPELVNMHIAVHAQDTHTDHLLHSRLIQTPVELCWIA